MLKQIWIKNISGIIFLVLISVTSLAQSVRNIDSLEKLLETENEISKRIKFYYQLSNEYSTIDIDKSFSIAKQALNLASNIDDASDFGKLNILLGNLSLMKDQPDMAEQYFKAAIPFLEKAKLMKELIQAHLSIGNRYIERDNFSEALSHYLAAVRYAERENINDFNANLYNNLGVVYLKLNNHEKALELYSAALELFNTKGDTINIAGTTTNIGSIYLQLEDYDVARNNYLNGLKLFKSIKHPEGQAHALLKLGLLEGKLKNYDVALDYLHESIDIQNKIDQSAFSKKMFQAETFVNLGINYLAIDDFLNAEFYLEEGYKLSSQTKQNTSIALASENLSKYFKKKKMFEKSLGYYEVYKQYSDSLFNEDNVKNITRIEMNNQFEEKLRDAELKQIVKEQKRKNINLFYLVVSIGLFLILIIVVLLLRLEKNKKKKVEVEKEALFEKLEHTNKELTTYVMYSLRKNEFIMSIIGKLKKARIEANPGNKKVIAELISELKSNTDMVSWDEFELRFQEVHTDFYSNLRAQFPDLSTNEIRMSAFFRLNMTSKEIAAITYQSLNSIKVARYRLRKKLKLGKEENLISYLSRF